ncbi:EAL domain-containing protein [Yoonia sp. BS5-3]|uniref:Bifunctional diguanylate cyclase/phosphodiesterase n=1 Tax=Yoonia phaeophyticola TaxID=3137369 RepID=A0ABZ2V4W0_9RHOB
MHYSVALFIIFGLLFATITVNRISIERSAAATEIIKTSTAQVIHGHEVLLLTENISTNNTSDLHDLAKLAIRLETAHFGMMSSGIWSDDLQALYFEDRQPLHRMMTDFIQMSRQFLDADPDQRDQLLTKLIACFEQEGLEEALLSAAFLFEEAANADVQALTVLQRKLLIATIVALIVEGIFIFTPAQLVVNSNIRKLRHQSDVLRGSEAALQSANAKLEYIINHDPLTDLPNRSCLMAYLENSISDGTVGELGILFIGIDGFKSINDEVGHEYGDRVLITVGNILQSCIDDDHLVARVGGDEFVLVTDEPPKALVDRVRASFADPLEIGGRRLPIVTSIGYLKLTEAHQDPFTILADVGLALQYAKNEGGNRSQPFELTLRDEIGSQKQLQIELSDAIKNGEIEPWFQPQIRLSDGRLQGAEVLARWRHPKHGLLTPDKFLPAAERAGLTIDMDHCIWRRAMDLANNWGRTNIWRPCISLNAAPDTIADPHLMERFLLQLQQSGLDVNQVVIEVLETTLINGADDMAAINIDSLAECGVALELDDFGTGYASLSKLTQLPLSGIKLDRSLIAPLPDQNADSVVRAILALAAELGFHVIAEGVEESVQAEHLKSRGCTLAQGYGYARPMPPDDFEQWLAQNANRALDAGGEQPTQALRA